MILNDRQISQLCVDTEKPMITPFEPGLVRQKASAKVISYGCSSFGYDMRLGTSFKLSAPYILGQSHPIHSTPPNRNYVVDPKFPEDCKWFPFDSDAPIELYPGTLLLGLSVEWWQMPDDVVGVVIGKSTYARAGVIINCTPMEPGWNGNLVIEIMNGNNKPVLIYPGEGIAQVLFLRGERPAITYGDRGGKYQNQTELQVGKV